MHEKIKFTKKGLDTLEADVLISYTTTDLVWRGPGIANTLIALDPDIANHCGRTGNLKIGSAVLLPPGKLSYKYICHAAISDIGQDGTEVSIRQAMTWAFSLISELRMESVVVPTLYTEATGMPIGLSADIVLRECLVYASSSPWLKTLTIAAQSDLEYREYKKYSKAFSK